MDSFHRVKQDSRILTFVALGVALILALAFLMVGFHRIEEEGRVTMEVIFGIAGVALFVIFVRGAWIMTTGAGDVCFQH